MVFGTPLLKGLTKFDISYTYYLNPFLPIGKEEFVVTPLPSYVNPKEVYLRLENESDYIYLDNFLKVINTWEDMNVKVNIMTLPVETQGAQIINE